MILLLQSENDEAALAKMLEKMAFGEDGGLGGVPNEDMGGLGEILPAMQGMLQSLLSKELLYPSIKDIVNKVTNVNEVELDLTGKSNKRFTNEVSRLVGRQPFKAGSKRVRKVQPSVLHHAAGLQRIWERKGKRW